MFLFRLFLTPFYLIPIVAAWVIDVVFGGGEPKP